MDEYLLINHMELIPSDELDTPSGQCYYIPYHCVFKEQSTTTKLRVVFDASCKTINSKSLELQHGFIDLKKEHLSSSELTSSIHNIILLNFNHKFLLQTLPTNSKLLSLSLFIDESGLLRVGGRLCHSNLQFDEKHPIILPRDHFITELIVQQCHLDHLHSGLQLTMSALRLQYWIPAGRILVKKIIHQCMVCFRAKRQVTKQIMGDLPMHRIVKSNPFTKIGIDFAGPFLIKPNIKRSKVKLKSYVALFVCFCTKAVHIEIISDLSSAAFLAAPKRFISRRGKPSDMFTSTNQKFIYNERLNWHFIPPSAPNFGGIWEARIKSFKFHLLRCLKSQILTFEELSTLTTQIEACLNSQPICPLKYLNNLQQLLKWQKSSPNIKEGDLILLKDTISPPSMYWSLGRITKVFPGADGKTTKKKKIMQNINPPEQFNFNNPNEWPNWIKRFERFRKASELKSKKEEEQVNALIYILGEKAEDALISFNLTEIEINNYETVVKKFEEHFIGKRNVIFERAQFNRRYQQDGEAVEEYIRVLHKMAENCNYGSLKEEMIRDRIVVGVKNLQLSEKLQLEPNLTLERAIQAACQTECVKQQQTILRSTTTQAANVDQVYEKKLPPRRFNSTNGKGDASKKSKFQKWSKPEKSGCIRCGASKFHPHKDCPAKEVKCHKCKKVGHFAKMCYNKTVGQVTQGDDYHFVGNIHENGQNTNDWKVYVKVDKIKILFKMDTGADVNIIPQEIYFKNFAHKKLCKPDIQLLGPRQVKLHVIGKFTALIEKDGRSIPGEIFVVPQLMQPLLSGKACESLNLIKILQSIEKRNSLNPFEEYPKLFTGLGTLQGSYTIKLKDESQPHAIYTPRRIPIPLLNKTKEQLDQMVEKE
ncbi:hypothetical protein LAZ67_5001162 [Cordylochernes scorpioides]|uniref:CCHC-type domain-containing protein n=1 Tax=Cordylochernes scorpioides TaxID=51811 RepID=A0ABY6KFD9_9ARAC|nr:hypothetical protein LAZ67_5001162 [Cordylochernes scorpioides]